MKYLGQAFIVLASICVTVSGSAISYVWNGTVSADWGTPGNWTPAGIPDAGDDVTVVAATNICLLDASRNVDGFVISSGLLNLNGFTLSPSLNVTLSGGTLQNGVFSGSAGVANLATLGGVTLAADATLNIVSGRVLVNGGTYFGAVALEQTGGTNSNGTGGAVFHGSFSLTLGGTSYWRTTGNCTFNGTVNLINNGSTYLLPALTNANTYNNTVRLENNGSGSIRMAYAQPTTFSGNIELNITNGTINFCELAAAEATLNAGAVLTVGGVGFTSGNLVLRKINQLGVDAQIISANAVGTRLEILDCVWNGEVDFGAGRIWTRGSTFNSTARLEKKNVDADYSGGNTFNGPTTLVHTGTINSFRFGRDNPDVFNNNLSLENYNNGHIRMADNSVGNVVNGKLTVLNNSTNWVYFCNEATSDLLINGDIELNSTGASSGVIFGTTGNPITQAAGFDITIGATGWDAGELRFTDFQKLSNNPVNLLLTGNGNFTSNNSNWNGNLSIVSMRLNTNGSVFNGAVTFEKTGNGDDVSGGNTFNQPLQLIHSANNDIRFGQNNPDVFNNTLRLRNQGTGSILIARNVAGNEFNGNVIFEHISGTGIYIGEVGGTSTLANGFAFQIGGLGFNDGVLNLRNITQLGGTAQTLSTASNSRITTTGSTFNGPVSFVSQRIIVNNNTFNNTVLLEKNGAGNDNSAGGNVFNGSTTIRLTGVNQLLFGNTDPDVFNGALTVYNAANDYIYLSHSSIGNVFNGIVLFESVASNGIRIGEGGGTSTLTTGNTLNVGPAGFDSGELRLRNLTQLGLTAQNLTLSGTARLLSMESTWNGALNFVSPRIYTRGSTYNNTAYWEKTGVTDDVSAGNNIFNQALTLVNSSPNIIYFGQGNLDIFNGTTTLRNTGTSTIRMCNTSAGNLFNGDIVVESVGSGGVWFGQGGGDASLASGFVVSKGALGFDAGQLRFENFTQLGPTPQNLDLSGTATMFHNNAEWNGNVLFSAPRITTRLSRYFGTASLTKTSNGDDDSPGNNVFHLATTLTNQGSSRFGMGFTNADQFLNDLTVINTGTSDFRIADNSSGNLVAGNLLIQNLSNNGIIYFNQAGVGDIEFQGDIEINSSATANGVRFGNVTLNASFLEQVAGRTITIGPGGFHNGELRFVNFTKLGADPITLTLTGAGYFRSFESIWNGNVEFIAPQVYTRGTTYNGTALLHKTGATIDQSVGNNTFNQAATLLNTSATAYLGMGWTNPDIFNGMLTARTTGGSAIYIGHNSVGNEYNGNVIVESLGSTGVRIGEGGGTGTLASGRTLSVGALGFDSGILYVRSFTQVGATAQNVTLTGTASFTLYDDNWGGNVDFRSPRITTRGTTYNGTAYIEKNGAGDDASVGGNTFMQNAEFLVSGTGYLMPANTQGNTYFGDVLYRKTLSGLMYPTYQSTSFYHGNITVNANSAVTFAAGGAGRVSMAGGANQTINVVGATPQPIFRRLTIDKTGGEVTLNTPITVSLELDLQNRNLVSTAANLLWMAHGSAVAAVSNNSFVSGPVRKVGNAAFVFPIGKLGFYQPAAISAPANAAHHFTAEYFYYDPVLAGLPDTPVENPIIRISDCEHWIIDRTNGASNVSVTLSYQDKGWSCSGVVDPAELVVARWDGAEWKNHGNGGVTGAPANGTIITSGAVTAFSPFTLATLDEINPLPIELLSFDAKVQGTSVLCSWITATETNSSHFNVERSANGVDWEFVGKTDAAGYSSTLKNYGLFDISPLNGNSFYRLIQYDIDMAFEIFDPVAVFIGSDNIISVWPNPTSDHVQIDIKQGVDAKVLDVSGRVILEIRLSDGVNNLNVATLANGTYFLSTPEGTVKFVKN